MTCPDLQVPSCPKGSVLTKSYTPPSGCCPSVPPTCTCDLHACPKPQCPSGQRAVPLSEASGRPGDCCDVFECQKGDLLRTARCTLRFDWPPTGGSSGTVGVRCIAFEEAIIFLRVRLSSLLTKGPQMKRKAADWIITVGLFIRLGRCLPGLRLWFKDIFAGGVSIHQYFYCL